MANTWAIVEGPLVDVVLGLVLAGVVLALLSEYRRMFMADPKSIISVELLMHSITGAGGPGYFAAFLITGALLCFALAILTLLFNVSQFLGR